MGQFASRAFDGDPYIDIMRALPDKELVWWVQKVLWLAEGLTILEHFGRTYPNMFMHKCLMCNGAGTVTCPHCNGYKVKRAHAHAFKLSEHTTVGRLMAVADMKECDQCGTYCPWDNESEWQEEWNKWESRLSYYDRTYGGLMDEWYEDVINEGRLDEDTQPEDEPLPGKEDQRLTAKISRDVAKDKQRLKALMRRMGGHPYEHSHMMPYGIIDPAKPLSDNLQAIGYNRFDLPPELHPEKFPDLLLEGSNGALQQYDKQIQAEYLIMNNLDAALRDAPKPAMFQPSAGTVACPACHGQAWASHFFPNLSRIMKTEQPFWARTFARMQGYWHTYSTSDDHPNYSPWMALTMAGEQQQSSNSSSQQQQAEAGQRRRTLGEIPTQPPLMTEQQAAKLEESLRVKGLPKLSNKIIDEADAKRPDGSIDFGILAARLGGGMPSSPWYLLDYGTKVLPDARDMKAAAAQILPASKPSAYGPRDPLSRDPDQAMSADDMTKQVLQAPSGPLLKGHVLDAQLKAAEVLNPAREAARRLRDARQLGKAETTDEKEVMMKWAQMQPSFRG